MKLTLRLLVCGGQNYAHRHRVFEELDKLAEGFDLVIIHGHCPTGADHYADEWAISHGLVPFRFPAKWGKGTGAGFVRNQEMIDKGKPGMGLAFPGGTGTEDMIRRLKRAGIEVKEVKT